MSRFDTHDGIGLGVKGGIPTEDLDGDRIGLDTIASARQLLIDDVFKEVVATRTGFEICTAENTAKLISTLGFRRAGFSL